MSNDDVSQKHYIYIYIWQDVRCSTMAIQQNLVFCSKHLHKLWKQQRQIIAILPSSFEEAGHAGVGNEGRERGGHLNKMT